MALLSSLRKRTSTRSTRRHGFQIRPTVPRFRPRLEALEDRWMPSTLTVTKPFDGYGYNPGELRYDIQVAQSGDTIVIDPSLSGQTIKLGGELVIDKSLTIQNLGAQNVVLWGGNYVSGAFSQDTRVLEIEPVVQVTLAGLTIRNGQVLSSPTYTREFPYEYGNDGAGILNFGALTLSNCTVRQNINHYGSGGGIYNVGTLTVNDSAFLWNHSTFGGGIFSANGYPAFRATATLTNCTLAYNNTVGDGGALYVGGSTATLTNCTVSLNTTLGGHGGGIFVTLTDPVKHTPGDILNLTNTIVAQNRINSSGADPDIYGALATADHNLVGDATGSTGIVNGVNGNIVGGNGHPVINADLGPLQNNGGPTQTMALLPGSLAIGHGNNAFAPAKDQRGFTRLDELGERTDIGAFEL